MTRVKMVQEQSVDTPLKWQFEIDFGKWPVQICPDGKALKASWTYFHLTKCRDRVQMSRFSPGPIFNPGRPTKNTLFTLDMFLRYVTL